MDIQATRERVPKTGAYRCVSCGNILQLHRGDDFPSCPVENKAAEWQSAIAEVEKAERGRGQAGKEAVEGSTADVASWFNMA